MADSATDIMSDDREYHAFGHGIRDISRDSMKYCLKSRSRFDDAAKSECEIT